MENITQDPEPENYQI